MMKYIWIEEPFTAKELSALIGRKVYSIKRGEIVVGLDPETGDATTREGIEIEFEGSPRQAQLKQLESIFQTPRRLRRI